MQKAHLSHRAMTVRIPASNHAIICKLAHEFGVSRNAITLLILQFGVAAIYDELDQEIRAHIQRDVFAQIGCTA
jgi:hypothetical protein